MHFIFSKINRITASGLGPETRGLSAWPRAWPRGPERRLGSGLASPAARPQTVPAEVSACNAVSADISVFYGVFIFSFMVQLKTVQLLFLVSFKCAQAPTGRLCC